MGGSFQYLLRASFMDDLKRYFTVRQVARKLDYSEEWVRDLILTKQLKAVKIKQWRVKPEDLEKFVKSRSNYA